MAKKRTLEEEAVAAGERNVVPGQSWLAALIRGIGREMQGSQGTPFGQATREELGSLGYEQMLREQFPEEFARGRLYGSEMFPTDIASMYAMRPGRSTFSPAMAEARAAGEVRSAPMGRLEYTPVAEAPRGSFDANMMAAFRRGEVGSRPAGRPQAFRPEDFLAIEQGPFAQSPNAFEGNMVMAQRRGMPSPSPANYDYQGPAVPGPMTDRPVSGFDRNMLDWARSGRTPPTRTGTFREGDFPPYTPDEAGQAVAAYRPQTMVEGGRLPPGGLPAREGNKVPSYRYVGSDLDRYPRGEYQAPYGEYGEFRDVTGNVLPGPAREAPYSGSMDFGVTREGASAKRAGLDPVIKALIAGAAADAGLRGGYNALFGGGENPLAVDYRGFGLRGRDNVATPRLTDFYPVEPMAAAPQGTMSQQGQPALPVTEAPAPSAGKTRTAKTSQKKASERNAAPSATAATQQLEPNFNYYVTEAIDKLLGQREAQRGLDTQQYYATHPWPY